MTHLLPLSSHGQRLFTAEADPAADVIVRNAMAMLEAELVNRHGVTPAAPMQPAGRIILGKPVPGTPTGTDDQTFHLRTHRDCDRWTITVTGTGARGILYGVCELLDRIERRGTDLRLPELNATSSPAMTKRGTERHWPPLLSDDAGVQANIQLIQALARRRINTLLWTDGWIAPSWYRFLDFRHYKALQQPQRLMQIQVAKQCLRRVVTEARNWGMEFYLGTTEFNVPQRLLTVSPHLFHTTEAGFKVLRFELPETWTFYRAKIREMMEDIPELSGIELWTAEAMDASLCHYDHPESWPLHRQIEHIYEQTLQAMDDAGRPDARLVCATFIHHPDGEEVFEPLCGRLPQRCEGRMKMQVEDFYRFHDPTTLAGRITPGREWIEMDPGGEHRGDWIGWINVHLRYLHERMTHYHRQCGVRQFICRVRGFAPGPYSKPVGDLAVLDGVQAIKYAAYFRWCWDPSLSIEEIWRQCKPADYPDAMLEFYLLSEEVSDKVQNVGRCLVNNNHASFLGSVDHYEYKMGLLNVYGNDACRSRGGILEPTLENLEAIIAEKDEAVVAAARMQEILEQCRPKLPAEDYQTLKRTMDYQQQCVRVWRYHTEAFFRYRLYVLNRPGGEFTSLYRACDDCQAEIRKLRTMDENQADAAQALIGNLRSLAWVKACRVQMGPKGIIQET